MGLCDTRRSFVTGASSGVGRAICEAIVAEGGKVAAVARDADRLRSLHETLGDAILPLPCDIRDHRALAAAAETAAARFGGLDCVVANAGVSNASLIRSGDPEHWKTVLDTNLFGPMATLRATLPHFARTGQRDVVVIGSISAIVAHPTWPAYAASKAGSAMLTECVRQELAPEDIRVVNVEFGQVETEIRERSTIEPGVDQLSPLQTLPGGATRMPPQAIAEMVLFAITRPEGIHLNRIIARPSGCLS